MLTYKLPNPPCHAKRRNSSAAAAHPPAVPESPRHTLVLYTTRDCPLCAALEVALHAALQAASYRGDGELRAAVLTTVTLEAGSCDAATAALASQVPLLRRRGRDGRESMLPRPPPRTTVLRLAALLEKELAAAAAAEGADAGGVETSWDAASRGLAWDGEQTDAL